VTKNERRGGGEAPMAAASARASAPPQAEYPDEEEPF
jgi:hypothetical protein